jgi:cytochrome c oxidase accessory protein FixG
MNLVPLKDITPAVPRQASGPYTRLRTLLGVGLTGLFFALPWLRWEDAPLLWLDSAGGQLHLAGVRFWPEDLGLLAGVLLVAAFGLFWVTVLAGRVWCGYACPQTVWAALFTACARIAQGRRPVKHLLWLALSALTAFTLVALFIPGPVLWGQLLSGTPGTAIWAWLTGLTLATYGNAGWFRSKLCVYVCPYGRFQSVMFDPHTPVVTYHSARGEPRGRYRAGQSGAGQGDCVACTLCVQVCPTGIDIRQGLQIGCIACGACVDACNGVMAKLHRPMGLIAYGQQGLEHGGLRPRLIGYGLVLLGCMAMLGHGVANRPLLALTVSKDRQLYRLLGEGAVENVFTLTLKNKDRHPHTYTLAVTGPHELAWQGANQLRLAPYEQRTQVIRLALPAAHAARHALVFQASSKEDVVNVDSQFTGPLP